MAAEVDEGVKAYFAKFSMPAEPSEHFPLMELPEYNCEEKLATGEVYYHSEKEYTTEDCVCLGRAISVLKPPTLKQIYLSKNQLDDDAAIGLSAGLAAMSEMDVLHLANNEIGDAGLAAIAESSKHLGLSKLILSHNSFGDEGAIALSKILADTANFVGLKWLYLNGSNISDAGAAAIGEALVTGCKHLIRIGLQDCKIGDAGMESLADAINKGAMVQEGEFFYVQNNPFTDVGKEAFVQACRGKIRVHTGWPPPLGGRNPEDYD